MKDREEINEQSNYFESFDCNKIEKITATYLVMYIINGKMKHIFKQCIFSKHSIF